jgi:ribose 5-phosphate isomerase RpiB
MKISIGNDHAGQIIKAIVKMLISKGYEVNYGTDEEV